MSPREAPPSCLNAAHELYRALLTQQVDGVLPDTCMVGVICAADHAQIYVQIGGLTDEFILGPNTSRAHIAHIDPLTHFTPEARRLRYRIVDLARETLPRKSSGELWFAIDVWLMTEPFWRSPQFQIEGVTTLGKGNPQ